MGTGEYLFSCIHVGGVDARQTSQGATIGASVDLCYIYPLHLFYSLILKRALVG
jgi:hypothetical protein